MQKRDKRLIIGCGLAAIAAAAVIFLVYKERDSYRCETCSTRKDVFQWRIGFWNGGVIPLSPNWTTVEESRVQHDFFGADHDHHWLFAQGSPYYLFGTTAGSCAIGPGRHVNDICRLYETTPEFREFIAKKLRDGSLVKSKVCELAAMRQNDGPLKAEADALVESFFSQL